MTTTENQAECFRCLRVMLGYVQDGSIEKVEIEQDDVAKNFVLRIGNASLARQRVYYSDTFEGVVKIAAKAEMEADDIPPLWGAL